MCDCSMKPNANLVNTKLLSTKGMGASGEQTRLHTTIFIQSMSGQISTLAFLPVWYTSHENIELSRPCDY